MKKKVLFASCFVIATFLAILVFNLVDSPTRDAEFLRKKNQQLPDPEFVKTLYDLKGDDLFFYVITPRVSNPNLAKTAGRKGYLTAGGTPNKDDGLQRETWFGETKTHFRTLRFSIIPTNEPDPADSTGKIKLVKIGVKMRDSFRGKQIQGFLVANSAGPVVDNDTSKEFVNDWKMQWYWRIIKYKDGFALVNTWQKSNRRLGFVNRNPDAKSFFARWSDPKYDTGDQYILPLYWETRSAPGNYGPTDLYTYK